MRRTLAATTLTAALGAGALTAVPAAHAGTCWDGPPCADPTPVSVSVSPASTTIGSTGSQTVALTAVFDDPDDTMDGVDFTVSLPDGTTRLAFATGYLSKSGARETYRTTYTAYSFYAPGVYRVTAVANRSPRTSAFTGTPQAQTTFTVRHKVTSTFYASKTFFRPGEKLRFSGTVRSTTDAGGLKVQLQLKAQGKKKFKKKGKAVRTDASGAWRTKKIKMTTPGRWRAKISGKGYVVGTTTDVLRSRFRRL